MKKLFLFLVLILSLFANFSLAQIENGSFTFDGNDRKYMVFLPQAYSEETKIPLLIYLHSYGWSAQKGMNYTKLNEVSDTSNFIVAYPSAMPNWNSGIADNPSWPTPNVDDVAFISALIDTLVVNYSIDKQRVFVCGYSNGGFMAYKLACQLSHKIAAFASVGGVISSNTLLNCDLANSVPFLHIHGTNDTWVPINGKTGWHSVDESIAYMEENNECMLVDTTYLPNIDTNDYCTVEKIRYSNCSNNVNSFYYKVINGGHTWPGAGPTGFSAGNTNQDFIASETVWNFFKSIQLYTSDRSEPGMDQGNILLEQNYPNPCRNSSTIEFTLPQSEHVKIDIFDMSGNFLKVLINEHLAQGPHQIKLISDNLPNGMYTYKIYAGGTHHCKKLIVLR